MAGKNRRADDIIGTVMAGTAGVELRRRRWWLRRAAWVAGATILAGVGTGCVVWPAGSGPNAEPMPLAEAIDRRDRGEVVIIDVRSRAAFAEGHIPDALSIPAEEFPARTDEIRRLGRLPVLYCG
jgi:hypothetical protein